MDQSTFQMRQLRALLLTEIMLQRLLVSNILAWNRLMGHYLCYLLMNRITILLFPFQEELLLILADQGMVPYLSLQKVWRGMIEEIQ